MDYADTYPNVIVRHHDSDMVLHVDSDAAYLVLLKVRSRIAGYFQLSNHLKCNDPPFLDGSMLVSCKFLHHTVSSAAESETAGFFFTISNLLSQFDTCSKLSIMPSQQLLLKMITLLQLCTQQHPSETIQIVRCETSLA